MANTELLPPETELQPDPRDGRPVETAPASAPISGPPPVFTSMDRMTVKQDPKSAAIAIGVHVLLFALILWYTLTRTNVIIQHPLQATMITVPSPPPPPLKLPPKTLTSGGGGGQHDLTPVEKGRIPPPKIQSKIDPKINIPVTVDIPKDVHMNSNLPNFGNPNSPIVGTGSMGNGKGAGIGNGSGNGVGPGEGGGTGGGVKRPGGGVSNPVVLFAPEPEFSEEARKAKVAGNVLVYLQVDTNGHPIHVRVIRGIGMGLDEKAVEAVRQYRFKPAMEDGHPVTVEMNVEVNFQIF
jgi:protein TonB